MDIQAEWSTAWCFCAALLCLILPFSWIAAAVTAAVVHEVFHILAVLISGGRIYGIRIGIHGAVLYGSSLSVPRQLLSVLAGPMGSLLLILTGRYVPQLAFCGFVQGIFNLLPLYPLDGGRVLRLVLENCMAQERAERICRWTDRTVIVALIGLGFWASFVQKIGAGPVMLSFLLVSGSGYGKISCKEGNLGVQ